MKERKKSRQIEGWPESRHDWALVKNGCLSILNYIARLITEEAKLSVHYHITKTGSWCACMTEPICQKGSPPRTRTDRPARALATVHLSSFIIKASTLHVADQLNYKISDWGLWQHKHHGRSDHKSTDRIRVRFSMNYFMTHYVCLNVHALFLTNPQGRQDSTEMLNIFS